MLTEKQTGLVGSLCVSFDFEVARNVSLFEIKFFTDLLVYFNIQLTPFFCPKALA